MKNVLNVKKLNKMQEKQKAIDELIASLSELIRSLSRINNTCDVLNKVDKQRLESSKELLKRYSVLPPFIKQS